MPDIAQTINLYVQRDRDYAHLFQFLQQDGGNPVITTGWTAKAQIRRSMKQSSTLIAEFTVDLTDVDLGIIVLSLTAADTAAITRPKGYYDIELISPDPDNLSFSIVKGEVSISDYPTEDAAL